MSDSSSGRRYSFSLLTLLVTTSVAAAFLGGWASRDHWDYTPGSSLERPAGSPKFSREQAEKSLQIHKEENDALRRNVADLEPSSVVDDRETAATLKRRMRINGEAIARLNKSLSLLALFRRPEEWAFPVSLAIATFIAGFVLGRRRQVGNP